MKEPPAFEVSAEVKATALKYLMIYDKEVQNHEWKYRQVMAKLKKLHANRDYELGFALYQTWCELKDK